MGRHFTVTGTIEAPTVAPVGFADLSSAEGSGRGL